MSEYRRATLQDLAKIGYVPNISKYSKHMDFAKKYYPPEATTMVMVVNSEYNDSTYDNELSYILVYDMNGDELTPIKVKAKECRENWYTLPIPNTTSGCYSNLESEEPLEDVVIPLNNEIPEFYIKVK